MRRAGRGTERHAPVPLPVRPRARPPARRGVAVRRGAAPGPGRGQRARGRECGPWRPGEPRAAVAEKGLAVELRQVLQRDLAGPDAPPQILAVARDDLGASAIATDDPGIAPGRAAVDPDDPVAVSVLLPLPAQVRPVPHAHDVRHSRISSSSLRHRSSPSLAGPDCPVAVAARDTRPDRSHDGRARRPRQPRSGVASGAVARTERSGVEDPEGWRREDACQDGAARRGDASAVRHPSPAPPARCLRRWLRCGFPPDARRPHVGGARQGSAPECRGRGRSGCPRPFRP